MAIRAPDGANKDTDTELVLVLLILFRKKQASLNHGQLERGWREIGDPEGQRYCPTILVLILTTRLLILIHITRIMM